MDKNSPLTEHEFSKYKPDKRIIELIENFQNENNLHPEKMNVLDWGCGRGRSVLWFRQRGYNTYGIDIDKTPLENGKALFKKFHQDPESLQMINVDGTVQFEDNFFHIIYSDQVFEHVQDLETVACEMNRLMIRGGCGIHLFPPHLHITEKHLRMPFVHWLPKSSLRKYCIFFYVKLGVEPEWKELADMNHANKADIYYEYSIQKTYYRKPNDIKNIFNQYGLIGEFDTVSNPSVSHHKFFSKLIKSKRFKKIINYFLIRHIRTEFFIKKP